MTQQRDDIVGRLEELVSSGRKLEPVAGSLLTIHLDMLEEAAAEITRLRAENAELADDVRIWKSEAANRSQGMVDLNLDRASMGVRIMQLEEALSEAEQRGARAGLEAAAKCAEHEAILSAFRGETCSEDMAAEFGFEAEFAASLASTIRALDPTKLEGLEHG